VPRRLGQHFLKPASVERLLAAIAPQPDETFLEIGPGKGALTLPLAARAKRVVAVELDARLASELRARAPANLTLIVADALKVELGALVPRGARLVGNLPYNISSPLLRRFLDLRAHAKDGHVMLQDEVAHRIAAAPGSRDYGILSVLFGLCSDVSVPLRFEASCFAPPPRVDSALLRFRFRPDAGDAARHMPALEKVLRTAFAHRRKTLENNLQDSYPNLKENLRLLKIEGRRRPETLSVAEFVALSERLR
jgi:16S rRNA (adenine1518-N6/adenine1519-N6)-dimethyltransferase